MDSEIEAWTGTRNAVARTALTATRVDAQPFQKRAAAVRHARVSESNSASVAQRPCRPPPPTFAPVPRTTRTYSASLRLCLDGLLAALRRRSRRHGAARRRCQGADVTRMKTRFAPRGSKLRGREKARSRTRGTRRSRFVVRTTAAPSQSSGLAVARLVPVLLRGLRDGPVCGPDERSDERIDVAASFGLHRRVRRAPRRATARLLAIAGAHAIAVEAVAGAGVVRGGSMCRTRNPHPHERDPAQQRESDRREENAARHARGPAQESSDALCVRNGKCQRARLPSGRRRHEPPTARPRVASRLDRPATRTRPSA